MPRARALRVTTDGIERLFEDGHVEKLSRFERLMGWTRRQGRITFVPLPHPLFPHPAVLRRPVEGEAGVDLESLAHPVAFLADLSHVLPELRIPLPMAALRAILHPILRVGLHASLWAGFVLLLTSINLDRATPARVVIPALVVGSVIALSELDRRLHRVAYRPIRRRPLVARD